LSREGQSQSQGSIHRSDSSERQQVTWQAFDGSNRLLGSLSGVISNAPNRVAFDFVSIAVRPERWRVAPSMLRKPVISCLKVAVLAARWAE